MIDMNVVFRAMMEREASDLHMRVGCPPVLRINGVLYAANVPPMSLDDIKAVLDFILTEEQRATYAREYELDCGFGLASVGRFRVNVFSQRGTPALAIRAIRTVVPLFTTLNLPEVILDIAQKNRGLILVTGTTGSGKSTLLASMIDHINETKTSNIITIEDPIEFLFKDKKSSIAQREVGADTKSFTRALRACFREDPNLIMIGEIRDVETMETALQASDTGHLVLSTLHTMNAVETITRIISFFPPHQHEQVRIILSNVLVAVVSLRLVPCKDGKGRVPAAEVLVNNATIAEYIIDPLKARLIPQAIADGYTQYGSQTFDQSLFRLYKDERITLQTALQYANNPDDFELKVSAGVSGTSDRW